VSQKQTSLHTEQNCSHSREHLDKQITVLGISHMVLKTRDSRSYNQLLKRKRALQKATLFTFANTQAALNSVQCTETLLAVYITRTNGTNV